MHITRVENGKRSKGVEVKALLGMHEFEQLNGQLDNLCVVALTTVAETASVIKTGRRHAYTKWLTFPSVLRRQFQTTEYDFEQAKCGTIQYKNELIIIYRVPHKVVSPSAGPET